MEKTETFLNNVHIVIELTNGLRLQNSKPVILPQIIGYVNHLEILVKIHFPKTLLCEKIIFVGETPGNC
jgi:hypothetical protein